MALGNTNGQKSDNKLHILKIKNKIIDPKTNKEIPAVPSVFDVLVKQEDKYVHQSYETQVAGNLVKIELDKGEWEGTQYDVVKLLLTDDEAKESYLCDLRMTSLTRNLYNSLLNIGDERNIKISLYKTHSEKHNKDFSNVALWAGDKHIKGKFEWASLPEVEKILDKKGKLVKTDTSAVDEFFVKELTTFAETINKGKKTHKKVSEPAPQSAPPTEVDEDSVPFSSPR